MVSLGQGMPKKYKYIRRRDAGKQGTVVCEQCGRVIPRHKAVCIETVESVVRDPALRRELEKRGAIVMAYPVKRCYCVSCAVYLGLVKIGGHAEKQRKLGKEHQLRI